LSATRFGFAVFAGIRSLVVFLPFRWHPLFAFGLLALPLCGAAPPFLCCCKEKGGKESSFNIGACQHNAFAHRS
jgi:hypothetical protein